ncbi:Tol-Pal system subunit TolQ [Alphaproteobacteria bacterium]|nr:Tol-Pal system subunit TolQ [Alphaproteobacteria bacterium]
MDNSQVAFQSSDMALAGAQNAHVIDSSIFSMFWSAGLMIKVVILVLLVASLWSWTIMLGKHFRLRSLHASADAFEDSFWSGMPLETLYNEVRDSELDPLTNVFCAAMAEWQHFTAKAHADSAIKTLEQRVERAMLIAIRKESDELEKHMGFLSSLGTNGVIVGLFGTVLGIMDGFKAIALQQNSNIATIAPIISEALVVTALGLVAAVPAAVGYNIIMNSMSRYITRLETFADEFSSIIARQLDEN